MKATLKKWVVRPLLVVVITLTVLAAIAFAVVSSQQQRLVNLAVDQINRELNGALSIEESSISVFKHFPDISVALHDGVFYADKSRAGRPIARFDRLYAGFNLEELANGNYNIRKLFLEGGYVDLVREKDGVINLLRPDTTSVSRKTSAKEPSAIAVHLEKIVLREMGFSFLDEATGQKVVAGIDKLTSTLNMDSSQVTVMVTSRFILDVTTRTDTVMFRNKAIQLGIVANYQFQPRAFEISNCQLRINEAGFDISGHASFAHATRLNFRVKGDQQDFNLFAALLPDDVKQDLKPFRYDGRLHFDAIVNGKVSGNSVPQIEVVFGCDDAWFLNTEANKKVDQLGFRGYYTNGPRHNLKTSELHIMNVTARPGKGIFKGHFAIRDFTNPQAVVKINSELDLKFLGEFFGIQDLRQMTGRIKLDMDYKEVHDIKLPEESLNKLREGIQSRLVVEDLSFQIPGYPVTVHDLNLKAEMQDGRLVVDSAYLKVGDSDLELNGSISDVRRFLHDQEKPVKIALNLSSSQLKLANLLPKDTALVHKWDEVIHGFNINLALETTVKNLLNPSPLPRGTFEMKRLRGTFKNYAHQVKDVGARVEISDTVLVLQNLTGMIDSSDFNLSGRIGQYHLWFDDIKKGRTQIAFDFRSKRFALRDVFTRNVRSLLPRGYRREQLNNAWLSARVNLRYDTSFRFMRARVTNVSADLRQHKLNLHEISGGVKYGSRILSLDTLKGKVGNSDFVVNLKYYFKGVDRYNKAIANSLIFKSTLLDVDEMSQYDLAARTGTVKRDSTGKFVAFIPDSAKHAQAFNIFMIPFSDFNAQVNIEKLKYNQILMNDVNLKMTMRKNQTIRVDTLTLKVAGGAVAMGGIFNGSNPDRIFVDSRLRFDNVDLANVMLKLDHFGQDLVVNKNVKGLISGEIISNVQVHPDLVPIVSNTRAEMNLRILNGSLVDFAPMQAMAGYFKDKNLRLIRFDTLENKLTFTNGVLDIPRMDINSSLGYIQVSGRQSVDLTMEYHVRVPLKVVTKAGLSAMFNRKPEEVDLNQVDQIEYLDKERKAAFMNLKVTGTPDQYEVGLGKKVKKKSLR